MLGLSWVYWLLLGCSGEAPCVVIDFRTLSIRYVGYRCRLQVDVAPVYAYYFRGRDIVCKDVHETPVMFALELWYPYSVNLYCRIYGVEELPYGDEPFSLQVK